MGRRGFTLIEALIALSVFSIVAVGLSPVMMRRARADRMATAATYRWALAAESVNRINATPAAALATGVVCDSANALPIRFQRCVTTTNVTTRLQRVVVVVLPLDQAWIGGDTLTIERANNVGPLNLGSP
ncbi:MAG: type II secretion system protein [Gemmatimonadales bacterium]|nr:type II secretion system protein [Gemmatimonadales bacterium]